MGVDGKGAEGIGTQVEGYLPSDVCVLELKSPLASPSGKNTVGIL